MYLLLEIYYNWNQKYKEDGIVDYKLGLKALKRDIYFLSEWLHIEDMNEKEMFELYSNNNQKMSFKTEIKKVLDFEEIKFKDFFDRYIPFYTKNISKWLVNNDVNNIYINLEKLSSFYPWMRAFYDLHIFFNKKGELRLTQPRTLDYLLIMTIRTEILIREIYEKKSGKLNISNFKNIIKGLNQYYNNKVLETVSNNIRLARLDNKSNIKPKDIFLEVENFSVGKNWSNQDKYFFKEILKFITSRNYFAHSYYKDDELNQAGEFSNEVLVACLHSVLYIGSVL